MWRPATTIKRADLYRNYPGAKPKSQTSRTKNHIMKTAIYYTVIICLAALTATAQQQSAPTQQESFPHRYLALGVRVAGIQVSDLTARAYPTNRLVLDIDPHQYFRIEGQLGIYSSKSEQEITSFNSGTNTLELHTKSTFLGFGIMGMYPKDRGKFTAGLRYSLDNYSDEDVNSNAQPVVFKNTGKMSMISGVIGGEYFLARFFSIGAEFSVSSVKDKYTPSSAGYNTEETNTTLLTEGSLLLRFYPF
jgi:hypothetical protein